MKAEVKVTFVDKSNPLELEGKKYYRTTFIDDDGFSGQFFPSKIMAFGETCKVELVENGGKYKFKMCK